MEKLGSVDAMTRVALTYCNNFNSACVIAEGSKHRQLRGFNWVLVSNMVSCPRADCSVAVEAEQTGRGTELNIAGLEGCICLNK